MRPAFKLENRHATARRERSLGPQVSHSKSTIDCPCQLGRSPRDGHASSPGDLVFRAPALAGSDDRRQRAPEVQLGTAPESSSLALAVNATAAARPGAHRDSTSTSTTGAPGAGGDCQDSEGESAGESASIVFKLWMDHSCQAGDARITVGGGGAVSDGKPSKRRALDAWRGRCNVLTDQGVIPSTLLTGLEGTRRYC